MEELIISNHVYKGNIDCFQNLLDIQKFFCVDEDVLIDFEGVKEVNPFNMLILSLAIRRRKKYWGGKVTYISPKVNNTDKYMQYMGFYETCGFINQDVSKGERRAGKYICITELEIKSCGSIEADYEMMEDEAKKLADMFQFDKKLGSYITYCFFEMIRNVYEHAETDRVYVCAQYWPTHCLMEIAIADEGCGIKKAMEKRFVGLSEKKLIEYAMTPGMSALSNHKYLEKDNYYGNSGYGLYMTKELALSYGGGFILCSGNYGVRYYCNDNGAQQIYHKTRFDGTAIAIRFCTELSNDFDSIRKSIVLKAERESNSYKDAIHKASRSSGGER